MFDAYPAVLIPVTPGFCILYFAGLMAFGYFSWLFGRWLDSF